MNVLSVFTWVKGEEYGSTIGQAMQEGKSLEEGIRIAYNTHGIIPEDKIRSGVLTQSPLLLAMGGLLGGFYHQKTGFFNEKLYSALIKVSQEINTNLLESMSNQESHSYDEELRKQILLILTEYGNGDNFFYVKPNIPDNLLNGAAKVIDKSPNDILGLLDASGNDKGDCGVYFLLEGIASRDNADSIFFATYGDLIEIRPKKHFIHVSYGAFKAYTGANFFIGFSKDQLIECIFRVCISYYELTQPEEQE